jgi:hypothetical protein
MRESPVDLSGRYAVAINCPAILGQEFRGDRQLAMGTDAPRQFQLLGPDEP